MLDSELKYFRKLKSDVSSVVRKSFPDNAEDITLWKGVEISNFQEDLVEKVNGRVSEKWFYTHIKADAEQMPRIDILNLLSQYVGYEDWAHYKSANTSRLPLATPPSKAKGIILVLVLLGVVTLLVLNAYVWKSRSYQFCFVNAYSNRAIAGSEIDVKVLHKYESPYKVEVGDAGCFDVTTDESTVTFVVRSGYYRGDTITRVLDKERNHEFVPLNPNDYAQMIHIYAGAKVGDWETRRTQLNQMIAPGARIYQLYGGAGIGMEMYNREEFIDKLTVPVKSLGDIEILETVYEDNQIVLLRFMQVKSE